jgi:hypothetical protein
MVLPLVRNKKMLKWFINILMVFCLCGFAYGETVTVTWNQPETANLKDFDLRVNETDIVNIPGADTREWSGNVTLVSGVNVFDMRARDLSDAISVWSEPAHYNKDGIVPAPYGVTIVLGYKQVVPQTDWILHYVDSEELIGEDGAAINSFDGNVNTFWHTEWQSSKPVHPHEIVIDLSCNRQICGFAYLPRQSGGYYGGIAAYEFYVSTDDQNWGNPVATGIFPRTHDKQEIVFSAKNARYIRLVVLSEVDGYAWTSVAEIGLSEWIK